MSIKHFLLWLPMIALAFANATLRELVLIKHFSEFRAHQVSTLTLIILCSVYIGLIFPVMNIQNSRQALFIGLAWVVLTVVFEFSLGRFTNKSWEYLFRDYNLFAGRIWLIFLFCLFLLPYLIYLVKNK
ncbi:MAG: hypothetical protein JST10_11640 [Bacteroidetes bacterium]|nr:hypothetical protein [Bacteroidota bacterium]MBS1633211.1 hypothetical protein [Bacteroidota bacterium]